MHDIFISYSSKNKTIADTICHYFESKGIRCWYAPRDIGPGEVWTDAIMQAIENAKCFLLIYSKESNGSKQVLNEITAAFNADCPIIPFRIDDVKMEKSMAYYLNSRHWLDAITPPLTEHLPILYETVCRVINVEVKTEQTEKVVDNKEKDNKENDTKEDTVSLVEKKHKKRRKIKLWQWMLVFILFVAIMIEEIIPRLNLNTQNVTERIYFQDISWLDGYTYPFYSTSMFSQEGDMYFVQDKETKTLSVAKMDTGYQTIKDISYFPENPEKSAVLFSEQYNIIYFFESNENSLTIKLFDKNKNIWINQEGICLELSETEYCGNIIYNRSYMTSSDDHLDEIIILIYDSSPDKQCYTKAVNIYSNATYEEFDISSYKLKEVIAGIDKAGEHTVLMLTNTFEVKVFDFVTRQPLELTMQQIQEMYLPYIVDKVSRFSENGRYLCTQEITANEIAKVTVWDLIEQKSVYSEMFTTNYSVYFQGDGTLLIWNGEDASLQSYDLETGRKNLILDRNDFDNKDVFLNRPFTFFYSDKLNVCFFVSPAFDEESKCNGVQLVMTGVDGTVLAESQELECTFENFYTDVIVGDDLLLFLVISSDPTLKSDDGISTHIFQTRYTVDENGKIEFY